MTNPPSNCMRPPPKNPHVRTSHPSGLCIDCRPCMAINWRYVKWRALRPAGASPNLGDQKNAVRADERRDGCFDPAPGPSDYSSARYRASDECDSYLHCRGGCSRRPAQNWRNESTSRPDRQRESARRAAENHLAVPRNEAAAYLSRVEKG